MPVPTKCSKEEKLIAVQDYLSNKRSAYRIAKDYNIRPGTVFQWLDLYEIFGEKGLTTPSKRTYYSDEVKSSALNDWLSGEYSKRDICKKYKIRSTTQVENWINDNNNHKNIKFQNTGGKIVMIKERPITFDERVEIVRDYLENSMNYNETAVKFNVSYQQVRLWVLKYEKGGLDALIDKRGRKKTEEELTELDRIKIENKLLKSKAKYLEVEVEFLKKLKEIERS